MSFGQFLFLYFVIRETATEFVESLLKKLMGRDPKDLQHKDARDLNFKHLHQKSGATKPRDYSESPPVYQDNRSQSMAQAVQSTTNDIPLQTICQVDPNISYNEEYPQGEPEKPEKTDVDVSFDIGVRNRNRESTNTS